MGFGSGAYSEKLIAGTRQQLSGFSQPRQCGDDVFRMLVTGGPPKLRWWRHSPTQAVGGFRRIRRAALSVTVYDREFQARLAESTIPSLIDRRFLGASTLSIRRSAAVTAFFLLFARTIRVVFSNEVHSAGLQAPLVASRL
jgi:hypothetical protein